LPPPPKTTSTHAQDRQINKNKGKQIAQWQQPLPPLDMPVIFITPEPDWTVVPQVLKDQAKANEAKKECHTCHKLARW